MCGNEEIKAVEDKIRDLINTIRVLQQEEVDGAGQKVQDGAADKLVAELEALAVQVGGLGGNASPKEESPCGSCHGCD